MTSLLKYVVPRIACCKHFSNPSTKSGVKAPITGFLFFSAPLARWKLYSREAKWPKAQPKVPASKGFVAARHGGHGRLCYAARCCHLGGHVQLNLLFCLFWDRRHLVCIFYLFNSRTKNVLVIIKSANSFGRPTAFDDEVADVRASDCSLLFDVRVLILAEYSAIIFGSYVYRSLVNR